MSNVYSPIFPIQEPHHFSDYGFDPQIDCFQVLEEARKYNKRESSRSIDTIHFKLQKPISKDESSKKIKKNKKRWWKNAFLFFKRAAHGGAATKDLDNHGGVQRGHACIGPISGPVYITESRSGSSTPYRKINRPSSGPLAGTLTSTGKDEVRIPYISLRELNMDQQHRISSNAMPIYFVT
ncbi:uncharacterized protein LOC111394056 [Olea europaea var. sylvestris]|uniref:Uncharacterized protein n=1 Tax=Olea europaea subsp. europaea TaxID=158383 RepID=A0A8S0QEF8_OLEEU|nr:uncharacterized protein LOC111394056 [Olea europaea var. sylvestris]CAA2964008.1 Hypothetical predicted protein [Olea europaea subsp. europaea]